MTDTQAVDLSPRFAEGSKMRAVGLAERYDAVTMNRIPEQWAHFQQRLGEVQGRFEQAQFGIFYQRGENPFAFEYVTAVMVDDDAPLPAGFVERRLTARPHAVFTHRGEPSGDIGAIRRGRMVMKGDAIYYPDEIHAALGIKPFARRAELKLPIGAQ
jgi:hypothetical protein